MDAQYCVIECWSEGGATPSHVFVILFPRLGCVLGASVGPPMAHAELSTGWRNRLYSNLNIEYRFYTGGDTGEIAISPTFLKTSAVVLGEDNRCVGPLPRVRSPSSSLVP